MLETDEKQESMSLKQKQLAKINSDNALVISIVDQDSEAGRTLNRSISHNPCNQRKSRSGLYMTLCYYPIFFLFCGILVWQASKKPYNKSTSFLIIIVALGITQFFSLLLCIFVFFYWKKSSIRAEQRMTLLMTLIAAILIPMSRIAQMVIYFGKTNLIYGSLSFDIITGFTATLANFSLFLLLSAIVLRLRFMYCYEVKKVLNPSNRSIILFYCLFYISTSWVIPYTKFKVHTPEVHLRWLALLLDSRVAMLLQYIYYMVLTHNTKSLFIDHHTKFRNLLILLVSFVPIIFAIGFRSYHPYIAQSLMYLLPVCLLWLHLFNCFFIIILHAVGVFLKIKVLATLQVDCLEGNHFFIMQRVVRLEEILMNDTSRDLFLEFSRSQFCQENVEFLIDLAHYRATIDLELKEQKLKELIRIYIQNSSPKQINLSAEVRDIVLGQSFASNKFLEKDVNDKLQMCENEILLLLSQDVLKGFLVWPEYLDFQRKSTRLHHSSLLSQKFGDLTHAAI